MARKESSGALLARSEIDVSRKPLVKMSLGSSEKGLVRLSDEEWWNRRSSSEVRAMLIGTSYPKCAEDPGEGDGTSVDGLISKAEGQGGNKKLARMVGRVKVESDA